ncbi:MAG: RidA family protein [Deltaproteobacteria bacterium]|nr:MAG: RidA family protein [Deltaproteobacteria bacterium]
MGAEARARQLGLDLSSRSGPLANYVGAVTTGNLVFLSGHGPLESGGGLVTGRLGEDLSVEQGAAAARRTAVALLATLKSEVGDLDRVGRIVKLLCMVNCTPDFAKHSAVADGASNLLVEVFGERGRHARSAVGVASLPFQMAVEIELIAELADTASAAPAASG